MRARDRLGEGPWWDAARAGLLWVDILGRRVRRATLDGVESDLLLTPSEVGFAVCDSDGRVLAGLSDGLAVSDSTGQDWIPIWTGSWDPAPGAHQ